MSSPQQVPNKRGHIVHAGPVALRQGDAASADAQRLQQQLASLAEKSGVPGAPVPLLPLLEFLRSLLAARTMAFLPPLKSASGRMEITGAEAPGLWKLAEALDPASAQVLPAPSLGTNGYTLSVPVHREGRMTGWLVALVAAPHPRDIPAFVVLLQASTGYLLYQEQRSVEKELYRVLESASGLLAVFRQAGAELDFAKACQMGLDALCKHLGCTRASLGLRKHGGLRMTAISGTPKLDRKSPTHQPCEAAMQEALLLGKPVDYTAGTSTSDDTAAHHILRKQTGAAHILTVPLARDRGALLFEWDHAPDPALTPVVDAATPFVPVLFDLLERARPNPVRFAMGRLWQRTSMGRRAAVLLGLVGLGVLLAWPFHYRIGADCRIAPTVKQVIAAPFDGQLRKSFVRPGDAVKAGDALGELDNRELTLKEAELVAARERALKDRDRSMTGSGREEGVDFAAAQMAVFEAQRVGQELELVRQKLSLLQVKSPLAGVVVSGDLRRAEGQPVPRGQVLWEVAPLDSLIVEIEVPDREIGRARQGQDVRVRLEAFGGGRWESQLVRIHPQSEQRDGKNIFIAEAAIAPEQAADLRPGMRGRASIESDRRPLIWILGHRLWDWVESSLFW